MVLTQRPIPPCLPGAMVGGDVNAHAIVMVKSSNRHTSAE